MRRSVTLEDGSEVHIIDSSADDMLHLVRFPEGGFAVYVGDRPEVKGFAWGYRKHGLLESARSHFRVLLESRG